MRQWQVPFLFLFFPPSTPPAPPRPLLSFVKNAFDSLEASWLSERGGGARRGEAAAVLDEGLGWLCDGHFSETCLARLSTSDTAVCVHAPTCLIASVTYSDWLWPLLRHFSAAAVCR